MWHFGGMIGGKGSFLNYLAVKVKKADLEDNLNVARLKNITESDTKRLEKYKQAMLMLVNLHE